MNNTNRILANKVTILCPKSKKVLFMKEQKNVYQLVLNNEKNSITVLVMVSAIGSIGPPIVISP